MRNKEQYMEDYPLQTEQQVIEEQWHHEEQHLKLFDDIRQPLLSPTKANIEAKIQDWTNAIQSGFIDPLEAHIRLKALVKVAEAVIKNTEEEAIRQARLYGKSGSKIGAEFTVSDGRANYKFDNSPAIMHLEAKLKAQKELAKTLAKNKQSAVVDAETGEVIDAAKIEYSKEILTVTYK